MATSQQPQERALDHRGERRLSPKESAIWYAIAAITYIGVGTWQKVLLTWFIGPMWVVATLTFGPRIYDRIRGRANGADGAKPVGQPDTSIPAGATNSASPAHSAHSAKDSTP